MKYGIYKNEWPSADVDPFTTITGESMEIHEDAYVFVRDETFMAAYPMSHFYVVNLTDD